MSRTLARAWALLACLSFAGSASAEIVCPDSSYVTVTFSQTFQGTYNPGQPRNRVTIAPGQSVETFASNGIVIHVFLKNCQGTPLVGVPPQEIVLFNNTMCICPGGNIADAATDANGHTTFTGTLRGGGCVENLLVFSDGVFIGNLPVKTNSHDAPPASPCFVDAGDFPGLVAMLGNPQNYSICRDTNEDGFIDMSELAYFASQLGVSCP